MNEVATRNNDSAELQSAFSEAERAMLSQLGLSDAPEGDLMLFHHVCQKSGLDPFRKEIFMIGRNTQVTRYVPNTSGDGQHKETRWETVYTIQTGIQGFRKRAREIADGKGDKLGFSGPYWCGPDDFVEQPDGEIVTRWRDFWPDGQIPVAAKYVVFRNGEPIPAVCHFDEYMQTTVRDGQRVPNTMWSQMPRNQIAKCAEALALQRAYPDELSGLNLDDAVQVIDETGAPAVLVPRRGGKGVSALRERAQAATQDAPDEAAQTATYGPFHGHDSEAVRQEIARQETNATDQPSGGMSEGSRRKWLKRMFQLLGEADCGGRDDHIIVISELAGRGAERLEHRDQLSDDELRQVVDRLNEWAKADVLTDQVSEILNYFTLAEENQTDETAKDSSE